MPDRRRAGPYFMTPPCGSGRRERQHTGKLLESIGFLAPAAKTARQPEKQAERGWPFGLACITSDAMGKGDKLPEKTPPSGAVDAFLKKLSAIPSVRPVGPRGRLIFALDATASRQPTWDQACHIQAEMFAAVGAMGGLDVQLAYYRGFREFEAFPWLDNSAELTRRMTG